MELTSGWLSVAGCLELLDDLVVVSERVFRGVRDHENGHGALLLTRRPTAKREAVYDYAPADGRVVFQRPLRHENAPTEAEAVKFQTVWILVSG